MKTLVTGAAGFLGYHVAERLLARGHEVVGLDNLNPYYSPHLKRARLKRLERHPRFEFAYLDLTDRAAMEALFDSRPFGLVVHLAAQAGVRYSTENPHAYTGSNVAGFLHVLEGARRVHLPHLIYASSSSVYGANLKTPFSVEDRCDHPVSLYAATKRANELMAHCYTHLFGIPTTGLRFFTVYGPWCRPDMAPWRFARAIEAGEPIDIYNYGRMQRDFTYAADAAEGVLRVAERPAEGYRLFNLGGSSPVGLMEFVHALEGALGKRARRRFLPLQKGDVVATHADVADFSRFTGFLPSTPLKTGIESFVHWYREWTRRGEAAASGMETAGHALAHVS
jgi:UDP-glucuronate 4-epimerase